MRLGDFATLYNGRAYKQNELFSEGKYPVLRVGNLFTNNQWYYSDLDLEPEKYCNSGDLLYSWSASLIVSNLVRNFDSEKSHISIMLR